MLQDLYWATTHVISWYLAFMLRIDRVSCNEYNLKFPASTYLWCHYRLSNFLKNMQASAKKNGGNQEEGVRHERKIRFSWIVSMLLDTLEGINTSDGSSLGTIWLQVESLIVKDMVIFPSQADSATSTPCLKYWAEIRVIVDFLVCVVQYSERRYLNRMRACDAQVPTLCVLVETFSESYVCESVRARVVRCACATVYVC